jgi:hypothetical protein
MITSPGRGVLESGSGEGLCGGDLAVALHRLLVAGRPATAALAAAQQEVAGIEPVAMAAAAGFVCLGADFTLPQLDPVPK